MNPEPFRISEDYLFAVIGRLHVENLVLRERLAEMERAMRPSGDAIHAMRPTRADQS